ncbi:MAG: hemerythrin domain-containing protein, partial [Acetobacteraceae bacterium]|nr:hemerythrin domain-containing protein [Acetobacteraceae bacterium]
AVDRVVEEHARLRALLERMRRVADHIEESPVEDLHSVKHAITELLLPHQRGEEQAVFPELARRLGGRDPLGAMKALRSGCGYRPASRGGGRTAFAC